MFLQSYTTLILPLGCLQVDLEYKALMNFSFVEIVSLINGQDLNKSKVQSWQECSHHCQTVVNCKFWTFHGHGNFYCKVFDNVNETKIRKDKPHWSGSRECIVAGTFLFHGNCMGSLICTLKSVSKLQVLSNN